MLSPCFQKLGDVVPIRFDLQVDFEDDLPKLFGYQVEIEDDLLNPIFLKRYPIRVRNRYFDGIPMEIENKERTRDRNP